MRQVHAHRDPSIKVTPFSLGDEIFERLCFLFKLKKEKTFYTFCFCLNFYNKHIKRSKTN